MTPRSPQPANRRSLQLGIVAAWALFGLMVVAISWTEATLRGRPFELDRTLIWNLGWVLWIGGTVLVARLARRFPLERGRASRWSLHLAASLALPAAILTSEYLLGLLAMQLRPGMPRPSVLLALFAYKFHVYFLIYWLVYGGARALDSTRRARETAMHAAALEARLAQAQLQTLKMQLHPHFLFNTHHSIISLMLKNETPAAVRMLTRLSDLLRITLRQTERQLTPLRDELAVLELYLGIQRERYRERLTVRLVVEETVRDALVPALLLQPLVENALTHGIDALGSGGAIEIEAARASVSSDQLVLTVRDNGPGLPAGFDLERSAGIGLRNTRDRLARLFGAAQQFTLTRGPAGGAEVRIALPCRFENAAQPAPPASDNVPSAHA